jgi:hypothetical protein
MEEADRGLLLDEVVQQLDSLDPGATLYKAARTIFRRAALDLHPDKNPNDPKATENFQRLLAAWESCAKRFNAPPVASETSESESYSPLSKPAPARPAYQKHKPNPSYADLNQEEHLSQKEEKEQWEVLRKSRLNENDGLRTILAAPTKSRAKRVMTMCHGDGNRKNVRLDGTLCYKSSDLLATLKKLNFEPCLAGGQVLFFWGFILDSEYTKALHLIGDDVAGGFTPSDKTQVYAFTLEDLHCKTNQDSVVELARKALERSHAASGSTKTTAVVVSKPTAAVVVAKPKRFQWPKCGTCNLTYKILRDQLQKCCKCNLTFHRECMPLFYGRMAEIGVASTSRHELSCGTRSKKGQLWADTAVPERYRGGFAMPEQFDGDLQLRYTSIDPFIHPSIHSLLHTSIHRYVHPSIHLTSY